MGENKHENLCTHCDLPCQRAGAIIALLCAMGGLFMRSSVTLVQASREDDVIYNLPRFPRGDRLAKCRTSVHPRPLCNGTRTPRCATTIPRRQESRFVFLPVLTSIAFPATTLGPLVSCMTAPVSSFALPCLQIIHVTFVP